MRTFVFILIVQRVPSSSSNLAWLIKAGQCRSRITVSDWQAGCPDGGYASTFWILWSAWVAKQNSRQLASRCWTVTLWPACNQGNFLWCLSVFVNSCCIAMTQFSNVVIVSHKYMCKLSCIFRISNGLFIQCRFRICCEEWLLSEIFLQTKSPQKLWSDHIRP